MTASEKQMIPLEAIPETNADIQEQPSAAKDLLDVKFPSRPRRKVIIILGVIAVFTVVIIAASLIGKYIPDYLRDANSNCKSLFPSLGGIFSISSLQSQFSTMKVQAISAPNS